MYFSQRTQISLRRLQVVFKSSRRLTTKPDVVTTSYRRCPIYDVLKTTDLRRLKDVQFATSWKRLIYNVLTYLTKFFFWWHLGFKRKKRKYKLRYVAMPVSGFHKNTNRDIYKANIFSSNKKNVLITHQGLLYCKK